MAVDLPAKQVGLSANPMKDLQKKIILLIIILTMFYVLEHFIVRMGSYDSISPFIYLIGITAVTLNIMMPFLWHSPISVPFGIWTAFYALVRVLISHSQPIDANEFTYTFMLIQIILLFYLIFLARDSALVLRDFENAVEDITFASSKRGVKTIIEAEDEIQKEVKRSRRYQRVLSLAVIEPEPASVEVTFNRTVHEIQRAMMGRYVALSIGRVIRQHIRPMDLMVEQDDVGRFIIICPETSHYGVNKLTERIRTVVAEQLGIVVLTGTSSFPDEALSFEELVEKAEQEIWPALEGNIHTSAYSET